VIGHNENRSSPFHREHVERLRSQTHADFPKAAVYGAAPSGCRRRRAFGEAALTPEG
jgi:hypothetical protein